jgi:hypothetical protein
MGTEADKTNTAVIATMFLVGAALMAGGSLAIVAMTRSEVKKFSAETGVYADLSSIQILRDEQRRELAHGKLPIQKAEDLVLSQLKSNPFAASPFTPPPDPNAGGGGAGGVGGASEERAGGEGGATAMGGAAGSDVGNHASETLGGGTTGSGGHPHGSQAHQHDGGDKAHEHDEPAPKPPASSPNEPKPDKPKDTPAGHDQPAPNKQPTPSGPTDEQ